MKLLDITTKQLKETLKYMVIVVVTFIILQSLVVVMHEFTHSTVAWLLGYMKSPLGIVWGNPIMMTGWDEGVHYSKYFSSVHLAAEAIIGASPLLVHTIIITLGLILMQTKMILEKKWLFHFLYWFVIANFMEIIAYITMRAFANNGDVGHFNHGLNISPWFVFIIGNLAIVFGLYVLFAKILPQMYAVFAPGNRLTQWVILFMTCFLLFIWGSGLRVVLYVRPDPQWMFGLLGFVAFGAVLIACRPAVAQTESRSE
ncbi:MAG: hypothetical protein K8T10_09170 [Candidatus Eremiobacteraeota bacterium]|nr:hypothetical protein [Candidatus Eremiobacteraeota bacterium]